MIPPERGGPDFTFAGFLILVALGTLLWQTVPLETARPTSERAGWYEEQVTEHYPARLWQDPFKAVFLHEQSLAKQNALAAGPHAQLYQDQFESVGALVWGPQQTKSQSAGNTKGLEQLRRKLNSGQHRTSILGVMVSMDSYVQDEDKR